MERLGDEDLLDVIDRVKSGATRPGDVAMLTEVRKVIDPDLHPAVANLIDEALAKGGGTNWIKEAEALGNVPTMTPPPGGFNGVPPNMGPMEDGRFSYVPSAAEAAQQQQGASERLFQLQQQTLPPGTLPMPGGTPFNAPGVMAAAGGPPGSLEAFRPPAPPPPRDPRTNPLEELNRKGELLRGQPTLDFASGLGSALGGLIGPAPPPPERGSGTLRIGTPDPIWRPFADTPAAAAAAAAPDLATAGAAAAADVSPFAFPGAATTPDYGEDPTLPPPDQGGARDRKAERRGTDWQVVRDAKRASRVGGYAALSLPEDSAFYGVHDLQELVYQPDLMARMIAEKMGGGAMTAAMIAPEVQTAVDLVQSGQLGNVPVESGLGPQDSTTAQLQAIEDFVTQSASSTGTQVDPYRAYKSGFKRALHTSEEALQEGVADDATRTETLNQQIYTTQKALFAGASGMGPGAANKLKSRLDKAASDWLILAMKSAPGEYITYPQYLKQINAQKWFR